MIRSWNFHYISPLGRLTLLGWMLAWAQPLAADHSKYSSFAGSETCRECHEAQFRNWRGSHHDLAMQAADDGSVIGDFEDAEFRHFGQSTRFFRSDGRFMVQTDDQEGAPSEFELKFTFGVAPLQQYLIEFPGGRLQALGVAWDARPKHAGGQRWFHLYDEPIAHDDPLHWTGIDQNWNHMCAECHSTQLEKAFDPATRTYATRYAEINVGCEACHGPAGAHAAWAKSPGETPHTGNGLVLPLNEGSIWTIDRETGLATRTPDGIATRQVELCARCHSRRGRIAADYQYGEPLLDSHLPVTLDDGLYYPDGQIRDEVYVYGSFIQSRMFHKGVACSDCHEAHSLQLHAEGDELCARCHLPDKFATPAHHFHDVKGPGARCTACHMPERLFMQIDARADHSFRVPRPDLSVTIGTPNACTQCHAGRSSKWAVEQLVSRGKLPQTDHYGTAIHAGRSGQPDAELRLLELLGDDGQPAVARATAAKLLRNYLSPTSVRILAASLQNTPPLVRHAVLTAIEPLALSDRIALAGPLLTDPIRAVRQEAGRILADAAGQLDESRLKPAIEDYLATQTMDADRPESHLNRGNLYLRQQRATEAEQAFKTAIAIDASFVPAYVNLADLYRATGRGDAEQKTIEDAVRRFADNPTVLHSYGLFLVRQGRSEEALGSLEKAAELAPRQSRFQYAYALALDANGDAQRAIEVLRNTHDTRPADRDVLFALASFSAKAGDGTAAVTYAKRLLELAPWDPQARALLASLQSK